MHFLHHKCDFFLSKTPPNWLSVGLFPTPYYAGIADIFWLR